MIFKFIKFGLVGLSGLILDYSITFVCKEKLKIHRYVSNALGFLVAAGSNYLLNRIWTFSSNNSEILMEYASFMLISITGLIINSLSLYVFDQKLNLGKSVSKKLKIMWKDDYSFYLSKLFAIGVTTIWNFLANYYITFNAV
jgi:putative flippase GtrA